jgi:hypothetical protein
MKNLIQSVYLLLLLATSTAALAGGSVRKESFKVAGNCEMCKSRIEASLKVAGVEAALWNPDSKVLKVKYQSTAITSEQIRLLVAKAGYDIDAVAADSTAYQALPSCCQYKANSCNHAT